MDEANNGDTPVNVAALNGHPETVQLLIEQNGDYTVSKNKNRFHGSALYAAFYEGHEQIVSFLLDKGADVNAHGGDYSIAL